MIELGIALSDVRARDPQPRPEERLREIFRGLLDDGEIVDAQFVDAAQNTVIGVAVLPFKAPVVSQLLADAELSRYLRRFWSEGKSTLILSCPTSDSCALHVASAEDRSVVDMPRGISGRVSSVLEAIPRWPGRLNDEGHHVIDLKSPSPGPHFFVNLLLGNRIGHDRPLQTTPKSVVDRLGRGSFRSHAGTQVLATRWDLRPEENGFPANRQFYLVEDGRQLFYSADPSDPDVLEARAIHAQNRTVITYRTRCGLEITRLIFLLPQEDGLPLATEVQSIWVKNDDKRARDLRLVVTGMFGPAAPGGLQEDVVYTNVCMQSRVLKDQNGSLAAISSHYQPQWAREDARFHSTIVRQGGTVSFPTEFCTSYNEFVGDGTLEHPRGVTLLSNRLDRRGPGFFALAANLHLPSGSTARADNFTGLVSGRLDGRNADENLPPQVQRLIERFSGEGEVDRALMSSLAFYSQYASHSEVHSGDPTFDCFVNRNLPFQILYQTFVSRSFDQTQKGYREIGFREVQDLFASTPFFIAMGHGRLVGSMLREWASQIFEFGYANHNFYWVGKEPGEWSDDALWFVQAVDTYLTHTSDTAFLDETCDVAGTTPPRQRTIYEAVKAVIRYSSIVSVGKHGLPLLDRADWNDTLRLDPDYLSGPAKEAAYRQQLAVGGDPDQPLQSNYSESVMNAFLLKVALDAAHGMASRRGDSAYARQLSEQASKLSDAVQEHAWKGDFFARILFNRSPQGRYTYLGAGGDGLSDDPKVDGTYFLNSFSWSILAAAATEEQIRTMLAVMKRVLLTPHGLRLCSPVRYREVTARGGSGEYFLGDRENGGVFKHANMMAAAACMKAAREVQSRQLAQELRDLAYATIDVVLPFRSMQDPYVLCGNPRFCTQYNNSETGENVGPMLSGTSTWLWLALRSAYGVRVSPEAIELDPVLREEQRELRIRLNTGKATYAITISKPRGFRRVRDDQVQVTVDREGQAPNRIPVFEDGRLHQVEMRFG